MTDSVKGFSGLSLAAAQRLGRLDEFVAQEERRGVGPAELSILDASLSKLIKGPKSKDRTSR